MPVEVTTYYLEMTNPQQLRPKPNDNPNFEIKPVGIPLPELNQFLYTIVGKAWFWTNRLNWTRQQWAEWVDRPELKTWVGYLSGTPAGYFELEVQPADSVEVAYFGLLPPFIGLGLGGPLLTAAVEQAWALGAARVWVHTCTLDHPRALANYQARGFRIFAHNNHSEDLAGPFSVD
ncbi:MAG: GNAT family N-acetyltransferase [Anaerolineae bacterium]|nr:GNAT family N-acetyltransferase [Anaerolineae bacterium]MCB0225233.1 GNAT family N-acetyltransferase [Anaerolineae bacterium]MCB9107316.1 GNAT family N-acetyltransferase [Anaerolineales bacterium]